MVLALDYLQRTRQARGDLEERFLDKIDVGYRRLLGFEVPGEPGGFDWWGRAPANLFLSAYGLMEFLDMARVYPVDPALPARIVRFLRSRQQEDGSWSPQGETATHSVDWGGGQAFGLKAYVAWGLARAGAPDPRALAWLAGHAAEVEDPYALALGALAFLASDAGRAEGHALADRLARLAERDDVGVAWRPRAATGVGSRGRSAAIETTALAVQALLLDGRHGALARRGVERIAAWRGPDGRFGATQSTILALQALLAAEEGRAAWEAADVVVVGPQGALATRTLRADSNEPEVLDLGGARPLEVRLGGEAAVEATVARTTWRPWSEARPSGGRLALEVAWPTDVLVPGVPARAEATVRNVSDQPASVVTLEIGIPPGCTVRPEDVQGEGAERVERGETTVVVYLRALAPGQARTFALPFTPRHALDVVTAPSKAYEYYVPEEEVLVAPRRVRAADRAP